MKDSHNYSHPFRDALSVVTVIIVLLLSSCHRNNDPLIGRWTVEKVNVEFNEQIATPEMVRQYGELEKGNVIEITKDSVLTFVTEGDTLTGFCSLRGAQLYFDGKFFGKIENGILATEISTPLGKIVTKYHRK